MIKIKKKAGWESSGFPIFCRLFYGQMLSIRTCPKAKMGDRKKFCIHAEKMANGADKETKRCNEITIIHGFPRIFHRTYPPRTASLPLALLQKSVSARPMAASGNY